jgi:hypothetical protein
MRAGSWSFFDYPAANSGLGLTNHNREAGTQVPPLPFFGFLFGACIASATIAKALGALSRQIVSLFSPDCPGKSTKSAFLLPNGVGASDPERLVC